MNNDQIKAKLLELRPDVEDFTVTMTGKKSSKVNGLYKPITREIILHNLNFESDDELMYTAIHEFAHHIQFTRTHTPGVARFHTAHFWNIFHTLLFDAEEMNLYTNIFVSNQEFIELTEKIKQEFIVEHGLLIQEFGKILLSAHELCDKYHVHFDDYVNRILKIKHSQAESLIRISSLELDPSLGYENMKALSRIGDGERRAQAQQDLKGEYSPVMVEMKYRQKEDEDDPLIVLTREKMKLEKTIDTLRKKLALVEHRIKEVEQGTPADIPEKQESDDETHSGGNTPRLKLVKPEKDGE
ncbi:MAG: hypothetical protein JW904_10885 [Spirochaetales bacterium]|nr:hypothetical protein [Spirochaetales bacterium]